MAPILVPFLIMYTIYCILQYFKMKKLIITESQARQLFNESFDTYKEPGPQEPSMKKANKPYSINPEHVKMVKKFLDKGFKRGNYERIGANGYPENIRIVAMLGQNGDVIKNMFTDQFHDLLVDKFQNMFSDMEERDLFFDRIIDDWFNNKIGVNGTLSVNHL